MITVDEVLKKGKNPAKTVNAVDEERPVTELKPQKKSYWPWVLLAGAAVALGVWVYKKGQNNGDLPV
jgi:hypothetical protein